MTKAVRILMAVVLVGVGLGSVLLLAGCDDEAAAEATSTRGTGSLPEATPVAAESPEVAGQDGEAGGELSILALSVDELIQQTDAYIGQEVVVRGTILTQCIRGCTFSLDDGTGVVSVELAEEGLENLLMTGSVGRIVEVRGIVEGPSRPLILVEDRDGWRYVD